MTKRDDTSRAEQNAEIRRWAEDNGLTLGSRLGQQQDVVERVAPRVAVVEFTVRIDEDVYEAAMLRVKEEIAQKYGRLNILINAAGGAVKSAMVPQDQMADPGEKTFFEVGADDIQKEFDLNMRGTWLPSKIMTPLMIGQQGACVLNVSSMSAFTPLTRIPGYSGAKAGVSNFTQWLATYLARSGVRVNAIAPGFFMTEQNHALQFNPDGTPTPRCAHIVDGTPMRRYGELRELIGAMLFLVDERAASFVTGVVLPVDGGYSAFSGV